jgi:hypothetical protein
VTGVGERGLQQTIFFNAAKQHKNFSYAFSLRKKPVNKNMDIFFVGHRKF